MREKLQALRDDLLGEYADAQRPFVCNSKSGLQQAGRVGETLSSVIQRLDSILDPLDLDALATECWHVYCKLRTQDPDGDELTGDAICEAFRAVLEKRLSTCADGANEMSEEKAVYGTPDMVRPEVTEAQEKLSLLMNTSIDSVTGDGWHRWPDEIPPDRKPSEGGLYLICAGNVVIPAIWSTTRTGHTHI
jgi:hypothetical protein